MTHVKEPLGQHFFLLSLGGGQFLMGTRIRSGADTWSLI